MSNTINDRLVPITDDRGRLLLAGRALPEPMPGSVVLSDGEYGTAWQRYFSDGLWYRVGGGAPRDWKNLLRKRNLVLIYDAPVREQREGEFQ